MNIIHDRYLKRAEFHMKKYFFLLFLIFASIHGFSQDTTGTVLMLNDKMGPTIDLEERNSYRLFMGTSDFESAVLFQMPDSTYAFKIFTLEEDGSPVKIRWMSSTLEEIELIRQYIETYHGDPDESPQKTPSAIMESLEESLDSESTIHAGMFF